MASSQDRETPECAPPNDGKESPNTQLMEDLDDRLSSLNDKIELCDTVLRDLEELQGLLEGKSLSDDPFPAQVNE